MEAIAIKTMNRGSRRLQHTIKCPACNRKLCDVALGASARPIVELHGASVQCDYDLDLRCASCKAFVGVKFG